MDNETPFKPYPDPGVLPTKPPPQDGERLVIRVDGLPPFKDIRRSIRNVNHPQYSSFVKLREAAILAMNGRAWYTGDVGLKVTLFFPDNELPDPRRDIVEYAGGIMDTIDGSHGPSFTYLPIVIQDDRQVNPLMLVREDSEELGYEVEVFFGCRPE